MADSVVRLRIDSSEYDNKLRNATTALNRFFDSARQGGQSIANADKSVEDAVRSFGNMAAKAQDARGKLNEMTRAFTEMSMQYKQLTDAEKQSPVGQAMAKSLDQLKGRINETKGQLAEVNKELGNTKTEGTAASGSLSSLTQVLGVGVGKLSAYAAAAGAAKVALDVMKDAFMDSETNIDTWEGTVASATSVYETFLLSLNSGDFSNFFNNLDNIITKAKDAYNAIDELGTVMTIINPERARLQARQQELRETIRREGAGSEKGKAAAAELKTNEQQLKGAFRREGEMNMTAFEAVVRQRLAEGGLNLNQKSFDFLMRTFSDAAAFDQLRAGAKGQAGGLVGGGGSFVTGGALTYRNDTRNTNQKILDLFTDEWRQQNSQYLTAAYNAQGAAASVGLRNARYLREPTGGGGKGGGRSGGSSDVITQILPVEDLEISSFGVVTSMKELKARLSRYTAMLDTATTAGEYKTATEGIANTTKLVGSQQHALQMGWDLGLTQAFDEQIANLEIQPITVPVEFDTDLGKSSKEMEKSWSAAANAIQSVGSSLASIEDPAAKVMGTIAQAIATMALSYAQASSAAAQNPANAGWGWIAFAATGLATMMSSIAAIKEATAGSYAEGGIIPGNNHSDGLLAAVSSGELILNTAQQDRVAAALSSNGCFAGRLEAIVTGEQLRLVLNNNSRRRNKGEYLTTKFSY